MKISKKLWFTLVCYVFILVLVANDAWMYQKPIGKIIHITEKRTASVEVSRGGTEEYYEQTIKVKLLNGEKKGTTMTYKNEYTSSRVIGQKYHVRDQVFLDGSQIKTQKRDTYLVAIVGAIFILLILLTGKQGFRTCITLALNTGIYFTGFYFYLRGHDVLRICNLLVLIFTIFTLVLLNGFKRKTLASILSTLTVFGCIIGIFFLVLEITPALDYGTMEYVGSLDNPEDLFIAEVMFAGLGAIMDVAITLSSAMEELLQKHPSITFKELFMSGREIGYDIMGTMISVLLFTFSAGLIPSFLIRMNNHISFITNAKLYIPFEISRFLIESIGIVLAIPISIGISSMVFRSNRRKESRS